MVRHNDELDAQKDGHLNVTIEIIEKIQVSRDILFDRSPLFVNRIIYD